MGRKDPLSIKNKRGVSMKIRLLLCLLMIFFISNPVYAKIGARFKQSPIITGTDPLKAASAEHADEAGVLSSVKTTDVAGMSGVYEEAGTGTDMSGWIGAYSQDGNILYRYPGVVGEVGQVWIQGTPLTNQTLPNGLIGTVIPMSPGDMTGGSSNYVESPPSYSDSPCIKGQYSYGVHDFKCIDTNTWDYYVVSGTDLVLANWSNLTPIIPTVTSITANGTGVAMLCSAPMQVGAGGSGGFVISVDATPVETTYSNIDASTINFTVPAILFGQTITATYTQPTNGFEAITGGGDLGGFINTAVTNETAPVGCTSPSDNILDDGFEGTGFELVWSQVGVGTLNADANRPGTQSPTALCTQSLYVETDTSNETYIYHNEGLARSDVYVRFYINPSIIPSGVYPYIFAATGGATPNTSPTANVQMSCNTTTASIRVRGTTDTTYESITVNGWNLVELHIVQNGASWLKINGGSEVAFTARDYAINYYFLGHTDTAPTAQMGTYFDLFAINTIAIGGE